MLHVFTDNVATNEMILLKLRYYYELCIIMFRGFLVLVTLRLKITRIILC